MLTERSSYLHKINHASKGGKQLEKIKHSASLDNLDLEEEEEEEENNDGSFIRQNLPFLVMQLFPLRCLRDMLVQART